MGILTTKGQVLAATKQILEAVGNGDWVAYSELCDENITCYEPGLFVDFLMYVP